MPGHYPPEPGMGGNGNLGGVTKRFCLISLRAGHLRAMFGAGHGKAGAVGREMQTLPGKPGSPLNGLGGWGAWGYSTSSYVLGTLALEVALCQSASFPIAQSGARGGGRRCRGVE